MSSPIGNPGKKVLLVCRCNLQRNELTPPRLRVKVGTFREDLASPSSDNLERVLGMLAIALCGWCRIEQG